MKQKPQRIITANGVPGRIVHTLPAAEGRDESIVVELDDGRRLEAPLHALQRLDEDRFLLTLNRGEEGETEVEAKRVIPVIREELDVRKRVVNTGKVRVSKVVSERTELVDEPLVRETVEVERVPVEQFVQERPVVRREGDTLVVPVVEEVLVVEKRLFLKEEVRLTTRRTETLDSREITLQSEELVVERVPADDEAQDDAGIVPRDRV